jgi:hypothetical protein
VSIVVLTLIAAILHDAVPHQWVHDDMGAMVAYAQGHDATPTATPHGAPTSTATVAPTGTQMATNTPTATAAPTMTPAATSTPSGSGTCAVHDPNAWHGTTGPGGCTYGHEHGDAPPSWATLAFNGPFNTSAIENGPAPSDDMPTMTGKHNAMKGALGPQTSNGQFYVRYHAASNVMDRMSRFHSFELWYKDSAGGVTHVSGWINSGVPTRFGDGTAGAGGRRNVSSNEIDIRPEVEVVTSMFGFNNLNPSEHWYFYPIGPTATGSWQPTISVLMDATTLDFANEAANPSMITWQRTGALGTSREITVTWGPRGGDNLPPFGVPFWSTQFGEVVSGPSDPRCTGQTSYPARPTATFHPFDVPETFNNVCLQQFLSATIPGFIEDTAYRDYSTTGIRLPN